MKIVVSKRAGFCFGVKRAVDIAFKLSSGKKKGVFTLGSIIHNPQVVERLKNHGISPTDNINRSGIKNLLIRTHGVPPHIYKELSRKNYDVIDATCPFVGKAQQYAKTLREEGYQILILGDREHPEVKSLVGFAGTKAIVVGPKESIPTFRGRIGIIVQTTQPFEFLEKVVRRVIAFTKEVKVYNTICDSTRLRQEDTVKLASSVDTVIIVGGKNSSNTKQLTNLSKNICNKVYHIETADEIRKSWFRGCDRVGVTGGASTPQWIIDEVVEKIKEISGRR